MPKATIPGRDDEHHRGGGDGRRRRGRRGIYLISPKRPAGNLT